MTYLSPYPGGCTPADIDDLYPLEVEEEELPDITVGPHGTLVFRGEGSFPGYYFASDLGEDSASTLPKALIVMAQYEADGLPYTVRHITRQP